MSIALDSGRVRRRPKLSRPHQRGPRRDEKTLPAGGFSSQSQNSGGAVVAAAHSGSRARCSSFVAESVRSRRKAPHRLVKLSALAQLAHGFCLDPTALDPAVDQTLLFGVDHALPRSAAGSPDAGRVAPPSTTQRNPSRPRGAQATGAPTQALRPQSSPSRLKQRAALDITRLAIGGELIAVDQAPEPDRLFDVSACLRLSSCSGALRFSYEALPHDRLLVCIQVAG